MSNDTVQDLKGLVHALCQAPDRARMEELLVDVPSAARSPRGETLLMLMAATSDVNASRLDVMLEHGDPNALDHNGWSALFHAVARDHLAIVEKLLPYTTSLTKPSGYTAMMLAAGSASVSMLELLAPRSDLGTACNEDQGSYAAHTALDRAIHQRNWSNARWLIQHTPLPQALAAFERAPSSWPKTMPASDPAHELAQCQRLLDIRRETQALRALLATTAARVKVRL